MNNDDSSENQHRQGVSLAAIKEFQVISNSYTAEFGRGYGAVVLVQTKSGTNAVHGEASYVLQNSSWNALNAFNTVRPSNDRPNYGGVIGFPILKDRLFAFASSEHGRWQGTRNYVKDVITADDLRLPRLTRGNDTPANRAFIENVIARFGTLTPNDPRSPRTYQGVETFSWPTTDASLRMDWNARTNDRFNARYQYSRQHITTDDVIVGENIQNNNRQANLGLTWTHVFSAHTVGEFRLGLGLRDTNANVRAGNNTPIIRFAGSPVAGTIIGNAGTFPIARDQADYQLVYNLTSLLGDRHSLKTGTDIRLSKLDDLADSFGRGFWNFNANCGGVVYPSAYAAFFDGCVARYTKAFGPFALENRINEYNLYAEDNWRISPSLVLNRSATEHPEPGRSVPRLRLHTRPAVSPPLGNIGQPDAGDALDPPVERERGTRPALAVDTVRDLQRIPRRGPPALRARQPRRDTRPRRHHRHQPPKQRPGRRCARSAGRENRQSGRRFPVRRHRLHPRA